MDVATLVNSTLWIVGSGAALFSAIQLVALARRFQVDGDVDRGVAFATGIALRRISTSRFACELRIELDGRAGDGRRRTLVEQIRDLNLTATERTQIVRALSERVRELNEEEARVEMELNATSPANAGTAR